MMLVVDESRAMFCSSLIMIMLYELGRYAYLYANERGLKLKACLDDHMEAVRSVYELGTEVKHGRSLICALQACSWILENQDARSLRRH